MKTAMTVAVLLVASSFSAFAADTSDQGPMQMTAAEMDLIVAGGNGHGPGDGTGNGGDRLRDGTGNGGGFGPGTGECLDPVE